MTNDGRPRDLSPVEADCWEALSEAAKAGFHKFAYSRTGDHEHVVYARTVPGKYVDMIEISGINPSYRAHAVRCSETPLVLPLGGVDGADREWQGTPLDVVRGVVNA